MRTLKIFELFEYRSLQNPIPVDNLKKYRIKHFETKI